MASALRGNYPFTTPLLMGENRLILLADWDNETTPVIAYSHNPLFGYADATTLQFAGLWQNNDGWTIYERGEAEPSF